MAKDRLIQGGEVGDEISESTQIVDTKTLRQVRESQGSLTAYLVVLTGPAVGSMHKLDRASVTLGRAQGSEVRIKDVGISRRHARLSRDGADVYIEDMDSANGTFLNGERVSRRLQLHDGDKITLGSTTILKFTYHDKLDESFQRQMVDAALRDSLTGAYNKKYFISHLETEYAYALRHAAPLSLIMFDVDHFKKVNDTYLHPGGDAVLIGLAELTRNIVRNEDLFARYGGEEFAVVCRGITMMQAGQMGERLRAEVERHEFFYKGSLIPITISVGVAGLPDLATHDVASLIEAADTALYAAKRGGRNRVMLAAERG